MAFGLSNAKRDATELEKMKCADLCEHEKEPLQEQVLAYELEIEGLVKERDVYFAKLRDIEVLAQEYETDGGEFVQKALAILYATESQWEEQDGGLPPAEEF